MEVLKGPAGQTIALVPVYIEDQGPFTFALDTGASNSTVALDIAKKLHLPVQGPAVKVGGAAAASSAIEVAVKKWRLGDIPLPPRTLLAADLFVFHKQAGLQGLLGSDVLSQFDVVTIDYQRQRLLFRQHR